MSENLLTTVCECGHEFGNLDIKPPLKPVLKHGFYGGRVKRLCDAVCPKCKKAYVLYLKQARGGWEVIDMEEGEDKKPKQRKPKDSEE